MVSNILKNSLRTFKKGKGYVMINILGLSIGIACSLIIFLFILHQLSYDTYHENKDRLFRVILDGKIGDQEINACWTASVIGPTIAADFPEVASFCRLNKWGETIVKNGDQNFIISDFAETDSSFFDLFSIPLIKGDRRNVLNEPHTMVLSESTARKIFGEKDPINAFLKINTQDEPYRITGIMADFPENTHINVDVFTSFMTNPRANDPEWLSNSFSTYLLLKPHTLETDVEAKFPGMVEKYVGPRVQELFGVSVEEFLSQGNRYSFHLQPITKIHIDPSIEHDAKPASDPKYLFIFGSIAILIILIASINFMNLSTAQATKRAKEVGVKKVNGSSRRALIMQFLSDSTIIALLALVVAILIVWITLPYFNNLLDARMKFGLFQHGYYWPGLIAFALVVGVFAGAYPAFYLSSFRPAAVLRGKVREGFRNGKLRSMLVSVQFLISIVLIIGTIIMYRQLTYMVNKEMGFDKERLMVIEQAGSIGDQINAFKEEILRLPGVANASVSTAVPGRNNNLNAYMLEGRNAETFLLQSNWVDYDFLDTYGLTMDQGRFFNREYGSDQQACVVNQKTMEEFGLKTLVSSRFMVIHDDGEINYIPIIGVSRDFHFRSLHNRISPYIMRFKTDGIYFGYITVKFASEASSQTIRQIENIWKRFASNNPLQYYFMENDILQMYRNERQNAQLSVLFTILGIFIAALGLFGLTSYTIEQRTKEVGVRKALGASVPGIFYLISKEIIALVCIATVVAWPLIFFVARNWLQNYYYRISLSVFEFAVGFLAAIAVAIATISYQTLKTTRINPAQTLRYE